MEFICVTKKIPLFVHEILSCCLSLHIFLTLFFQYFQIIGKSGTSKSLSLHILTEGMKGRRSPNPFLRKLPAVQSFGFQCSSATSTHAISECFEEASKFEKRAGSTSFIALVVCEEIGLAEANPKLPLKVLHGLLENPDVAFIGLSNYVLDPAKMNRAVSHTISIAPFHLPLIPHLLIQHRSVPLQIHFFHGMPEQADLASTALGMVDTSAGVMQALTQKAANAFLRLYQQQRVPDFFGLRDYYYFTRELASIYRSRGVIRPMDVEAALARQFGGCSRRDRDVIKRSFADLIPAPPTDLEPTRENLSVANMDLICENLRDQSARHLLIISRGEVARHLFVDEYLMYSEGQGRVCVLEGGYFSNDNDEKQLHHHLSEIKECMEKGRILVLINMDSVHECLLDVLNGRNTSVGSVQYARIVLGSQSESCLIHEKFKVVVIVDPLRARLLPAPFINRFEKHRLEWADISAPFLPEINKLTQWITHISAQIGSWQRPKDNQDSSSQKPCFLGFHKDSPHSLLTIIHQTHSGESTPLKLAKSRLLWLLRPECLSVALMKDIKVGRRYLESFHLESLHSMFENEPPAFRQSFPPMPQGDRFVIYTSSPYGLPSVALPPQLKDSFIIHLHHIGSETELINSLSQLWISTERRHLIIECSLDDKITSSHIPYCQRLCYKLTNHFERSCDRSKSIYIIVHMPSVQARKNVKIFFDHHWHCVFIDLLFPSPLIAPLKKLVSITDWTEPFLSRWLDPLEALRSFASRCVSVMRWNYGTWAHPFFHFVVKFHLCFQSQEIKWIPNRNAKTPARQSN